MKHILLLAAVLLTFGLQAQTVAKKQNNRTVPAVERAEKAHCEKAAADCCKKDAAAKCDKAAAKCDKAQAKCDKAKADCCKKK